MINAEVTYTGTGYEIYINESELNDWLLFLDSLTYFYQAEPERIPRINLYANNTAYSCGSPDQAKIYYITDYNKEIFIEDLICFYGITQNISECGYILPNGQCLDFSGRHLKCGLIKWQFVDGRKGINHDNIFGINNNGYCLTNFYRDLFMPAISFSNAIMKHSESIRTGFGSDEQPFIHVMNPMTDAQISTLTNYCSGSKLIVDCTDQNEMPVFDTEIVVSRSSLLDINKRIEDI